MPRPPRRSPTHPLPALALTLATALATLSSACGAPHGDPDGGLPDAGLPEGDAGALDAGAEDAGLYDAGLHDAGVVDAGLACPVLDLTPFRGEGCFCGAECDCYLDVPYGARATWTEGKRPATQAIDIYLPKPDGGVRPLVLWAHPNGSTKAVGSGAVGAELGLPLLREGYAFASAEFRHPAVNEGAPATDLAQAVQFLRCHAEPLDLDGERFAGVGRSRGTLLVWTAVQDDLASAESEDPAARESTRLRGVWAINAQTSYWGQWIAETFFDAASRPLVVAALGAENRGHAVGDVSAGDPPVHFIYDSPLADLPLTADACQSLGTGSIDCVHLPNFGERACAAYTEAGLAERCSAEYDQPASTLYRAGPWLRAVLAP